MRLRTKVAISILTFVVGISAVSTYLVKFKSDLNVYPIEFNTLIRESKSYNEKVVEIHAFYVQGYESSFLTDSNSKESITATCILGKESCEKIVDLLQNSSERQERITVIGRYHDSEYQEYDSYVHTIEILEVKLTNTQQNIK